MYAPLQPVETVELFPPLGDELLKTLRGLSADDWNAPTACAGWTVKDVAAHLLDTGMRRVSSLRDGYHPPASAEDLSEFDALVAYLNRLNEAWVSVFRRVSPAQIVDLMADLEGKLYPAFKALDMNATAGISVAWTGEPTAPVWLDVAREYTERWMHQMHIRDAVGLPLLLNQRFGFPLFDTFIRSLPYAYRFTPAEAGQAVVVRISGEGGGAWTLLRESQRWRLYAEEAPAPSTALTLDPDTAWRLFTKGIAPDAVQDALHVEGEPSLADGLLRAVAIMA